MIIWTLQPLFVYQQVRENGVFHCDPEQCAMPEFEDSYRWIADQMRKRIGPPPDGVEFPVWAWHTRNWRRARPDLRTARWDCGPGNQDYTCITMDVPDSDVLLSDFDSWHMVLNKSPIAESEQEFDQLYEEIDAMSKQDRMAFLSSNWERVFDIGKVSDHWMDRGRWIQATLWELRAEYIKDVRFFRTCCAKRAR